VIEELPEGEVGVSGVVSRQAPRRPVEADDVEEHPVECRVRDVPPLREQGGQRGPPPLDAGSLVGHAEAHVAVVRLHAEVMQQADEGRIRALVVHDEAGVDGVRLPVDLDLHRVGVPSSPLVALEERDVVLLTEQVSGYQARHPTPDHCDSRLVPSHEASIFSTKSIPT
jgi:hypothetical protein